MHKTTYGAALLTAGLLVIAGTVLRSTASENAPVGDAASIARAHTHYDHVLEELRAADTSALNAEQRAARSEAIARLQRYCDSEDYPVNTVDPSSNLPFYLDDAGRRCAVATLLHEMGGDEIVDRMARTNNHAFVSTLSDDPEFTAWLDVTGLTLAETVRIMAPATQGPGEDVGAVANPGASETTETEQPSPAPTGDPNPVTPGVPDPRRPGPTTPGGGPGGPTTGGGPTIGDGGTGGSLTASGGLRGRGGAGRETRSPLGPDAWTLWWEFSKTEFYSPNQLTLQGEPDSLTGSATGREIQDALRAEARREITPLVLAALGADEPEVRVAATATLARIQGAQAVPRLVELLSDASPAVRERALLALGATGSPAARETLLAIAQTGLHEGSTITPAARGLAHVGLGIGPNHGMRKSTEDMRAMFEKYADEREEPLELATIFYHQLAPHFRLANDFHQLHPADAEQPVAVRARAIELIPSITTDKKAAFEALQVYLNGRSLAMRRSAALAMGNLDHDLVLPQLMTAYELETEPVTRGFMLLSIARRGGETARGYLVRELRTGKDREMRPWTMLAMGLWARHQDDDAVRELLRATKLRKADGSARYLALGMARDAASIPELATAATKAKRPWDRARAAYALALIGTEEARTALRENVWTEKSTFVRGLQAFSLATFGHPEDAPFIVQAARETSDPNLVAPCAVGVRYHGSFEAFDLARRHATDPTVDPIGRAALIEALGLMLDAERPLATAALYRRANFGNLPTWAAAAYKSTF